ncbi:MAG: hypothetical protein CME88_06000 [Hirschia sp.]|nr:hypothetical protein [Hirschia sp.]MBF17915.1 hypothetical protein [Hirschia sp.]
MRMIGLFETPLKQGKTRPMANAEQSLRTSGAALGKSVLRVTVGIAGLTVLLYAPMTPAQAQAPIQYASSSKSPGSSAHRYQQIASAPSASAAVTPAGNRVEYRYPDQPDMVFGAYGPRKLENGAAPMAFSSSEAAVNVNTARQVTGVTAEYDTRQASLQPVSMTSNTPPHARHAASGTAVQKVGSPYQIQGRWYVPAEEPDYNEVGIGSWYGPQFHGKDTANGEVFDQNAMTAAHTTLPIPSIARVTNLENGKTIIVRINDRGPFIDNRIIDLSKKAADVIGYQDEGKARVRVEYIGPAPAAHNSLPAEAVAFNKRTEMQATPRKQLVKAQTQLPAQPQLATDAFLLQAGSFSELGNAHAMRANLQSVGPVFVKEARVKGRDYFRVMLGPWPSKSEAEAARMHLRGQGLDTVVVAAK